MKKLRIIIGMIAVLHIFPFLFTTFNKLSFTPCTFLQAYTAGWILNGYIIVLLGILLLIVWGLKDIFD
jgi:hypothetical protein